MKISSNHCLSLTVKARELELGENVHPLHVSHVMCHMSCVAYHMSCVVCQGVTFFFTKRLTWLVEGLLSTGPTPSSLVRTTWHHDTQWDVLCAAFCDLAMFFIGLVVICWNQESWRSAIGYRVQAGQTKRNFFLSQFWTVLSSISFPIDSCRDCITHS